MWPVQTVAEFCGGGDAELLPERGQEVGRGHGVLRYEGAPLVARAIHQPPGHAAAG